MADHNESLLTLARAFSKRVTKDPAMTTTEIPQVQESKTKKSVSVDPKNPRVDFTSGGEETCIQVSDEDYVEMMKVVKETQQVELEEMKRANKRAQEMHEANMEATKTATKAANENIDNNKMLRDATVREKRSAVIGNIGIAILTLCTGIGAGLAAYKGFRGETNANPSSGSGGAL